MLRIAQHGLFLHVAKQVAANTVGRGAMPLSQLRTVRGRTLHMSANSRWPRPLTAKTAASRRLKIGDLPFHMG